MLYYAVRPRPKRRSWKRVLITLLALVLLSYGILNYLKIDQPFTLIGSGSTILGAFDKPTQPIDSSLMAAKLQPTIHEFESRGWKLGLYVLDFKTGTTFAYNQDQPFEAASLTKVPVLVTVFDEIENGRMSFDQTLTMTSSDWQIYGTSDIPYTDGASFSVQYLLQHMANRSDNSAFQKFVNQIGPQKLESNLHNWGFQVLSIEKNATTAREMVRLFDLIYQSKLVNKSLTTKMLNLMVNTNEESRIPAGVPAGIRVIHKTGNAIGSLQDVGIVELQGRPYALAILTDDIDDEDTGTKLEAQLSRVVYEYIKSL